MSERNPWGLTRRECEVVAALVQHCCAKGAALEVGLTHQDVCNRIRRVALLMGVSNDVGVALKWDRWARTEGAAS